MAKTTPDIIGEVAQPRAPESALRDRVDSLRPAVVELEAVSKAFDDNIVLNDLSLSIAAGQVFGLIGPSGCGKTTLIRLLLGLTTPASGQVTVMGVNPREFSMEDREHIGYTPQGFFLYPTLTVYENARFVAGLYGVGWFKRRRRIKEILQFLEIWDARNRLAKEISGGMQRRLSLACALIHQPTLLFVDEPTAGLDPVLRARIWQYLQDLRDRGCTVVVTTQYIDEAIYCDRLGILSEGKMMAAGSPGELRRLAFGGDAIDIEATEFDRGDIASLYELPEVKNVQWSGPNQLRLWVDDAGFSTPAVTEALHDRGREITAVRAYVPTFDEVFIKLLEAEK